MNGMRFAEPAFVHGLWIVAAAVVLLFWLDGRGGRLLGRFVAEAMQARIVSRTSALRRRGRLVLLGVALAAIVLALMRPQWGFEFVSSRQVGAEIMIALDVSRSMLAEDVAPNRLERAKAEIRDLLPYLDGDQVGLIAFAGRATVLCPMTPDFGFLRLVLDNVDETSVSRGGTRLEEPIRKATAGFGPTGDLSRVMLLITDGEDHDSFPVDAAREAAERGIRILAIGFGDEDGSEIFVTDPATGARRRVTDADGRPVISRLDGDLLRELAVVTEGAYVPAGTGVLDLESIFEAHIRPLMRASGEEAGRTVHKDGFQWALLAAFVALVAAVATGSGRGALLVLPLAVSLGAGLPDPAHAQPAPGSAAAVDDPNAAPPPAADPLADGAGGTDRLEIPEDPREAFNRGLDRMEAGALDDAERLFEAARRAARGDGEVRYRATYDLGWVDVLRAEASIESAPEEALAALERAADWFREAIALRPDAEAPRRNLEIVLRRALALADALAKRDPESLEQRLDALIETQRGLNRGARALVEALQASDDPNASDALRAPFKSLAVEARKLLGEAASVADSASAELAQLTTVPEEERTPEDAMRAAQLEAMLGHQHRARERMGQSRSQLRRRQAERAHRRGAAALAHLKRAREQLQDPVRILDGLVSDTLQITGETRALAAAEVGLLTGPDDEQRSAPDWLDAPYLAEAQAALVERTTELDARFAGALAQPSEGLEPEQQAMLERVQAAAPHLSAATEAAGEARAALELADALEATTHQAAALAALVEAREQFLGLRGLIEVAYTDQRQIRGLLGEPDDAPAAAELGEYAPALVGLQEKNLARAERLSAMIDEMRAELDASPPDPDGDPAAAEQRKAEGERLALADGILALTESAMSGALRVLSAIGEAAGEESTVVAGRERTDAAVKGLENLRRLFFSIIEHLRDTARRQVELGDDTEAAGGLPEAEREPALPPIAARQTDLGGVAQQIAEQLHEQSFADPAELLGPEAAADPAAAEEAAERLTRASELVLTASEDMAAAGEALAGGSPEIDAVRTTQDAALEQLAEALALLEPPQQQDGEQQEEQQEQRQEQQQAEAGDEQQPEEQASADPGQLLQEVRDREAERHRDRRRPQAGYEPVEKDW